MNKFLTNLNTQNKERQNNILKYNMVRQSSVSFVRIMDNIGRYALILNANRLKKGMAVLSPIGGGIKATSEGINEIKLLLGINDKLFENGNDLRFIMSGSNVNKYREWFLDCKHREINPSREFYEELIDETGIFNKYDVENLQYNKIGYSTEFAETSRTGQEGKMTIYFFEFFDVDLKPKTLHKLIKSSRKRNSEIKFVTKGEIINKISRNGLNISKAAQSLLDIKDTILEFN